MENLQNVKLIEVFKYFEEIASIPRGSGNEKQISDYLYNFAKNLGLEVFQDKELNIIIKKPGSKGYENSKPVIIQGHMDMVCEKNKETDHDFTKEGIKLIKKGDYIYADGTTLGADDGIAIAYALALLSDKTIAHPPLEILLTTDEENGMTGAMAINGDHLTGRQLINIDNEDEGFLLVSCAGGIATKSEFIADKEKISDKVLYQILIRGLKGGHSGTEIDKGRGNANIIIGRILKSFEGEFDYNIVSINGGNKNNAIPREAEAVIAVDKSFEEKLNKEIEKWNNTINTEIYTDDPDVKITIEEFTKDVVYMYSKDSSLRLTNLLYLYPNGVQTMSREIKDLTESSTNLGIVKTTDNKVEFHSAVRSSKPSLKQNTVIKIKTITELLGAKFSSNAGYPAWQYKKDSPLRELCIKTYREIYKKDIKIYAIHAGVECGLFEERISGLDMVSFGPDIKDAHTPNEHISISSTERVWHYLLEILKGLK